MKQPYQFIAPLKEGPVDVVGDVHGEIDALEEIIDRLGYSQHGEHPEGRRLVFVGDLCDRGPDSPAVIDVVRELVVRGAAACVLGNHELNILRDSQKPGNRWFLEPDHPEQGVKGEFRECRAVALHAKDDVLAFFATLPLALERTDLRIVHAAWSTREVKVLRAEKGSIVETYERFEALTQKRLRDDGILDAALREEEQWRDRLRDKNAVVPLLTGLGMADEIYQMENPMRVLTSGVERMTKKPFFATGKWRMCDRVKWWEEYEERPSVVIGHYWRRFVPGSTSRRASTNPELFADEGPEAWFGPHQNVYCVDFSVGARYLERRSGTGPFETRLAAMRLPERELFCTE